jgi:hypothetical protein
VDAEELEPKVVGAGEGAFGNGRDALQCEVQRSIG